MPSSPPRPGGATPVRVLSLVLALGGCMALLRSGVTVDRMRAEAVWRALGDRLVDRRFRRADRAVDPMDRRAVAARDAARRTARRRWEAAGALLARGVSLAWSVARGTDGSTGTGPSDGGRSGVLRPHDPHSEPLRHRLRRLERDASAEHGLGGLGGHGPDGGRRRVSALARWQPRLSGRQGYARDMDADMDGDTIGTSHPFAAGDGTAPASAAVPATGLASDIASDPGPSASAATSTITLDLEAIESDLADVEIALARLEAGTYWTCEVTGQPLPDDLMAREPTRRRLPTA